MYLMYVDESGDTGLNQSPSNYFILSGLVIHELRWRDCLTRLYEFRKRIANSFDLRIHEEIRASRMMSRPGDLIKIKKNDRLTILRHFINEIAALPEVSIINVAVNKNDKAGQDIFELAWRALIQRFENTLSYKNFPGPRNPDDRGAIFPDEGETKKLKNLLRRMRHYNPVPYQASNDFRNLNVQYIIEDPNPRNSQDSFFIQAVDTIAYFLHQKIQPNLYIRQKGAHNYFDRFDNVLCKVASKTDKQGIVWL